MCGDMIIEYSSIHVASTVTTSFTRQSSMTLLEETPSWETVAYNIGVQVVPEIFCDLLCLRMEITGDRLPVLKVLKQDFTMSGIASRVLVLSLAIGLMLLAMTLN